MSKELSSVSDVFFFVCFYCSILENIEHLHQLINAQNLLAMIVIDGAIVPNNSKLLASYVEYSLLGMAGLFRKDKTHQEEIEELQELVQ